MGRYRYIFYDMMKDVPIAELPLQGTWFQRQLNQATNGVASVVLDIEGYSNTEILSSTIPGRTKLYVDRDGKLVWSGVVWTRTYQEQSKTLNLTFQTLESLLYRQYTDMDQKEIVRQLIMHMLAKPSYGFDWKLPGPFSVKTPRTESFPSYEGWSYGKAIEYMVDYQDGLDYTIEPRWIGSAAQDIVVIGDVLGNPVEISDLILEYPGTIQKFWYNESASKGAVTVLGFGKGEGKAMTRSSYTNPKYLTGGYPNLQSTYDNKDVSRQSTLDSQTRAYAELLRPPMSSPTIEIDPDGFPGLGDWNLGDYAHVNIESARFPRGLKMENVRIVGWELTPARKGTERDELRLIIAGNEDMLDEV
jgi:hypothetical protein